jgi:cation:H+ antiporter
VRLDPRGRYRFISRYLRAGRGRELERNGRVAGPAGALNAITVLLFIAGLVLLSVGANLLVRGAVALAARFGTPPLIIGLTVVAFGTSSPEVLVSIQAARAGDPAIALGNVIGSNIFNVLFILGLSAVITPLVVSERLVRRDVPVMIGVSVLTFLFASDGNLERLEGAILLTGIVLYVSILILRARSRGAAAVADLGAVPEIQPAATWMADAGFVVGGLVLLTLGARWLVNGAVTMATTLGVSELVIGLTVVAAGTSLPEVATSVAASMRGERDIAVGNVVGSNIFNLLLVLGSAAVVAPAGFHVPAAALTFDLPIMMAVAVACLPIFFTGYSIRRWEGGIFLGYYVAYTIFLVLDATKHAAAPIFGGFMLMFVVPLTVLTFGIVMWRSSRARRQRQTEDRSHARP